MAKALRTGQFTAVDHKGQQHILLIYTTFSPAGDFENPNDVVEGLKELRTLTGDPVNRLAQGEYEVAATGLKLRSTDPNAP